MRNGLWRLVSKKETKPAASKVDELDKWEMKAEKAAGDIYLLVENDQQWRAWSLLWGEKGKCEQIWNKPKPTNTNTKPTPNSKTHVL